MILLISPNIYKSFIENKMFLSFENKTEPLKKNNINYKKEVYGK